MSTNFQNKPLKVQCTGCGANVSRAGVLLLRCGDIEEACSAALGGLAPVVVVNTDPSLDQAQVVIQRLGGDRDSGPFSRIRDIRVDPSKSRSVAESSAAHPDHTDGTFDPQPPRFFILQVVVPDDDGGGINTFTSLDLMLMNMPASLRQCLESARVAYARQDDSGRIDRTVSPIIFRRDNGAKGFRWRDDEQVHPEPADGADPECLFAIEWIREYLRGCERLFYSGKKGDIIIVNNDRVLHGRTALSDRTSGRWVRRAWIA